MTEEIMKHVRLDQVVQFLAAPDPDRHREAPMRQVVEEVLLRDQSRHRNDAPAGGGLQHAIGILKARYLRRRGAQRAHPSQELRRRVALDQVDLAPVERRPDRVLVGRVTLPVLCHRVVGCGARIVAAQRAGLTGRN
jgi:hypothetical protein